MDHTDGSCPPALTRPGMSRRGLLRAGLLTTAALGAGELISGGRAFGATGLDFTSPATFDRFHQAFTDSGILGQSTHYNEIAGALTWGQSYVQQGLLRMYEAYRDRRHLDALISHIDDVLATRDSVRGVTDYRGQSLPVWRAGFPFTAGAVVMPDSQGGDCLEVRSVRRPIEKQNSYTGESMDLTPLVNVEISAEDGGAFTLTVRHDSLDTTDVLTGLTMDTVVQRVRDAWPTENLLTVADLRASAGAGEPAPGSAMMASQKASFLVHTGMITYPIAWLSRIILTDPKLRRDPALKAKAERYIAACEDALAVHDDDWRENDRGEGWYVFPKGSPVDLDGVEMPANQFLAPARTMLHLAPITGRQDYADRAAKMARTFKNQLVLGDNGAYSWNYWLDWGKVSRGYQVADDVSEYRLSYCCATQPEDISHGHIDLDLAIQAFHEGTVFTGQDMSRLAKTFTRNIATFTPSGDPTVWITVAGDGGRGNLEFDRLAAGWVAAAPWDDAIFRHVLSIYQNEDENISPDQTFYGFVVLGVGNLAWHAKTHA